MEKQEVCTAVMMPSSAEGAPAVVTLVLRAWRADPPRGTVFRYEATHIQTGDVAYFRSFESAAQHIRGLVESLPIQFRATRGAP